MSGKTWLATAAGIVALGTLVGLAATAAPTPPGGQTITPQPMPANFPTPAATINQWIATSNMGAMRGHAWSVWSDMTRPSGQIYNGANLPIWETWYGSDEVFPTTTAGGPVTLMKLQAPHARMVHSFFQKPLQFHHNLANLSAKLTANDDPSREVAFNKFSPDAAAFILAPQKGPGGATYAYNSQASLQKLNAAWPSSATGQQRTLNDFPVKAIETKPVFDFVKGSGLTAQPMWQGAGASTNAKNPDPTTWTTCVLIDPNAAVGPLRAATPQEIAKAQNVKGLACKTFLYGSVKLFYNFRMSAAEAAAFNAPLSPGAPKAAAGDYAVLQAMHVNTKEIPFWTWQTFYWQPGKDVGFPGSKAGMPTSLPAPWSSYATCANYDQTTTPNGKTMQVCFNPYLETAKAIPVGITSNCMSCHGTARIAKASADESYPTAYTAPIQFFKDPKYYNNRTTHADFSWAVPSAN